VPPFADNATDRVTFRFQFLAAIYVGTTIVSLVFSLGTSTHLLVSSSTTLFAGLLALMVHFHHHRRAGMPSDALIVFWMLSFIATGLRFRTVLQTAIVEGGGVEKATPADWILLAQAVLALTMGILEEVADYSLGSWNAKRLQDEFEEEEEEVRLIFLSVEGGFFSWLHQQSVQVFKQPFSLCGWSGGLFFFQNACPEERSGLFSRIYFGWMGILMFRGYRKPLTADSLWYDFFRIFLSSFGNLL
jgi:hypothetical protein